MLAPGTRLGPYEISGLLGAGGMGEVYRGRDTRLGREVAIKILPADRDGREMRARFEREARVISSLNHPHICSLFDVGDGYLVMELLDGETLADRLDRGPIPIRDALKFGQQIASALARAHREGILHRDLKPGNVMITRAGAKLLDFGLARDGRDPKERANDATEQKPLTREGAVLGTLQYMAPEQLSGSEVDARSDIFSLGAILYEMVTGKRAFEGSTRTSIISAILSSEPRAMSELQPLTPRSLEHVVLKCLAKEPDDRWESARDIAAELEWIASSISEGGGETSRAFPRRHRHTILWPLLAILIAVAAFFAGRQLLETRTPERQTRFHLSLPPSTEILGVDELGFNVSPDGERLAFAVQNTRGQKELWVHSFQSGSSALIEGSEGSSYPFWSPDSKSIAFFAGGQLKKVAAAGGPIAVLCDAASGRGGTWGRDGTILFTPTSRSPVFSVPATGGKPVQVTTLASDETAHRFPSLLPDGRHFLYAVGSAFVEGRARLMLGDVGTKKSKVLAENASSGQFVEPDRIAFVRNSTLVVARFDSDTEALIGEPAVITPDVAYHPAKNQGIFSIANDGTIVFLGGQYDQTELRMVDRSGRVESVLSEPAVHQMADLSYDGKRLASLRLQPASNFQVDLWITDLAGGATRRVSSDRYGFQDVRWVPDGNRVMVTGGSKGVLDLVLHTLTGTSSPLYESNYFKRHPDMSPDGKWVAFVEHRPDTQWDIMVADVPVTKPPRVFVGNRGMEGGPRFSPDGRFLAFMSSTGGGAADVYVRRFPDTGDQWQVSSGGGLWPRWNQDGRELFFERPDGTLMTVPVSIKGSFEAGAPKPLFALSRPVVTDGPALAGVTPDGKHFMVLTVVKVNRRSVFQVILNWRPTIP